MRGGQTVLGTQTFTNFTATRIAAGSAEFVGRPWVDVRNNYMPYLAAASLATTTGTITSGSKQLTLTSIAGWSTRHGVAIVLDNGTLFTSYITYISGMTATLNDAAPSDATAKTVYHDDTLAFQFAIAIAGGAGNCVVFPGGNYYFSQIKLTQELMINGCGQATKLFSLPANTLIPVILNSTSITGTTVANMSISGNKGAATAPTSAAVMKFDNGVALGSLHRQYGLYIVNGPNDGIQLIGWNRSQMWGFVVDSCNGYGMTLDGNCFFGEFNGVVKSSGLHGIYTLGGANMWNGVNVMYSGQVDATNYGDGVYWGTGAHGDIGTLFSNDNLRNGLHIDSGTGDPNGRLNLVATCHSNDGDHVRITSGDSNSLQLYFLGHPRQNANSGVNLVGGNQNDIRFVYNRQSFTSDLQVCIGANLSGADNYLSGRVGNKNNAGDILVFECEPLYVTQDWTRSSPGTLWRHPGATVYRMPG